MSASIGPKPFSVQSSAQLVVTTQIDVATGHCVRQALAELGVQFHGAAIRPEPIRPKTAGANDNVARIPTVMPALYEAVAKSRAQRTRRSIAGSALSLADRAQASVLQLLM